MTSASNDQPATREEAAAMWCIDLADGMLDPAERQRFDAWIDDPANARAFEDAARLWKTAGEAAELPEVIHLRAAALESYRAANGARWTRGIGIRWSRIGGLVAACLILLASTLYVVNRPTVYRTGIGERRIAMLDDGSRLSLDADSEVAVSLGRHQRQLTLVHGRAKFDVAKDPLKPFLVWAGDKVVVATGTAFSVELLRQQVHVILFEGHVAVLDKSTSRAALSEVRLRQSRQPADQMLTPGHELIALAGASAAGAVVAPADPAQSLSWERGQLNFEDEPLAAAIERMNRYSKVRISLGEGIAPGIRISGVYTAGDTAAFVEGVSALYRLKASSTEEGVTLSGI